MSEQAKTSEAKCPKCGSGRAYFRSVSHKNRLRCEDCKEEWLPEPHQASASRSP